MRSTKIKVLLLSRYTNVGASSRLRFYQFIPYLQDNDVNITASPFFDDKYIDDLYKNKISLLLIFRLYLKRINQMRKAKQFDLVWVEKEMLPWLPSWVEFWLFPTCIPLIVDYDDAVFHRYDQHKWIIVRRILGQKIDNVMRRASLVIVGNEYLESRAHSAGATHVEIIPTVVDIKRYSLNDHIVSDVVVIGWIGSPSTTKYLHQIGCALNQVVSMRKIKIVAVGASYGELTDLPIHVLPWTEATEVAEIKNFDIGIMPLPDELFEKGKCGYKLIQYMACAKPVIASPVGINKIIVVDGVNGFHATTHVDWVDTLIELIDNSVLRKKMGGAGRQAVENLYNISSVSPKILNLLRSFVKQTPD